MCICAAYQEGIEQLSSSEIAPLPTFTPLKLLNRRKKKEVNTLTKGICLQSVPTGLGLVFLLRVIRRKKKPVAVVLR